MAANSQLPRLEVCLSPALLHLSDTRNTVTVIIDVFRATSTIAAALHGGATSVMPVASVAECIALGEIIPDSLTAGERDGKVAEGLQHGNSPLEYPREFIAGKKLILTTTNGTRLLHMVQNADTIITGAFLNLDAVCSYLIARNMPVVLGCASWKDKFNLEDTLFAGALINRMRDHFSINDDAARAAAHLERSANGHYISFLKDSSHWHRLAAYGLEKDLEYCLHAEHSPGCPGPKERRAGCRAGSLNRICSHIHAPAQSQLRVFAGSIISDSYIGMATKTEAVSKVETASVLFGHLSAMAGHLRPISHLKQPSLRGCFGTKQTHALSSHTTLGLLRQATPPKPGEAFLAMTVFGVIHIFS